MSEPWITEPGVYDIPAREYHADPVVGGSLSSSGARKIMYPSCPALFKAWRDGVTEERGEHLDVGRAAHAKVLGVGEPIVVPVDKDGEPFERWDSKAAKTAVAEIRARGEIPVKSEVIKQIDAMAAAIRAHKVAGPLLHPDNGKAEQTVVWRDNTSGMWCRALVDWLTWIATDYKTADRVDPESFPKSLANWGYHKQLAWYVEGCQAVGLDIPDTALLVTQMKTEPYLVVTYQISADDLGRGHEFNRKARDIYRRCVAEDHWPGFTDPSGRCSDTDVLPITLPTWEQYAHDGASQRGAFELEGASL